MDGRKLPEMRGLKVIRDGSGGGTRTPDTRIMIPDVSEEYQSLDCKQGEFSLQLNQMDGDDGVNEFTPNWRSSAPLYEGMAVGPFHIWQHHDGWAVYNNDRFIVGADSKPAAIKLMADLHSSWVPAPPRPKREPAEDLAKCYFIGLIDGPIKIGASVKPAERIRDLQAACPYPVALLALSAGGFTTEAAYHKRFAAFRLHGEWFDRHPDILAEIDRLNSRAGKRLASPPALPNDEVTSHGY